MKKNLKLDLIIDNTDSWVWDYLGDLINALKRHSDNVNVYKNAEEIENGDVLFIISCNRILKKSVLLKHENNIVIHESDLPRDRGWSPVSWQVERGVNAVPVTLFEADELVDNGMWYLKDKIILNGFELIDEIRRKQVSKSIELMEKYLYQRPMALNPPEGEPTYNRRRNNKDQELNIYGNIIDQFNKLRVCDNERYPAHFFVEGRKYILKIYEEKPEGRDKNEILH